MKKYIKQTISLFLAVLLITTVFPAWVFAAQENTPKEEVVYINLKADGAVKEINVVNIFDLDKDGKIIDYGEYENLRNMTTTDDIEYKDNTVSIDTGAGKLYYEGKLKNNSMPWNISIKYFMDDKEYSAQKIAGMSGNLKIKMSITQNSDCNSSFFEGYALQTSLTLDTDKATNILAEGATVANIGSDKQLTYTILPNTEKDITVSARVKDFEMSSISINGIRMNLVIDMDDATLQDKIDEVIDAVNDLDEGADKLSNGASELYKGTGKLNTATKELYTGVGSLYNGATELNKGLKALTSKNKELTDGAWSAYKALCSAAQTQLNEQLSANGLKTVTLTPNTYSKVLLGVLAQMDADKVYNKAYNTALSKVTAQVESQADALYSGYSKSREDEIYLTYIKSQEDKLYEQVASEAVVKQLVESGAFTEEQAVAYLETEEGQILVANAISAMTDEQKEQIITTAVQSLTSEQKEQILQGAITSLTEDQKSEIRNAYIKQLMATEEVTTEINKAVKSVSKSAGKVSALKGQLDNYGAFYNGLVDYTNAVSSAAKGASALANGLSKLYINTGALKKAVGNLHIAVGTLKNGNKELKDGTGEFVSKTSGMDTQVDDEIDSIKSSITGEDVETVSFVSDKNTNIKSVQFVIQTESIEKEEPVDTEPEESEEPTFWQKLLRLFGIY